MRAEIAAFGVPQVSCTPPLARSCHSGWAVPSAPSLIYPLRTRATALESPYRVAHVTPWHREPAGPSPPHHGVTHWTHDSRYVPMMGSKRHPVLRADSSASTS